MLRWHLALYDWSSGRNKMFNSIHLALLALNGESGQMEGEKKIQKKYQVTCHEGCMQTSILVHFV